MLQPTLNMRVYLLPPPTVSRARSAPPPTKDEPPKQDETAPTTSTQGQLSPEDEIEIQEWMEERQRNGLAKGKARMDEFIEVGTPLTSDVQRVAR